MFISLSDVLFILEQYRYWLIFPIMIIEGPIVTIISGFFVYIGILNIYITYILLVVADVTGDILHYIIGRYWRESEFIKKYSRFFGYNEKSEQFLENHFERHKIKTYIFAKFSHGMGTAIQIAAGIARVNFFEFVWINFIGTIPKTALLLLLGFYMGNSYQKINEYINSAFLITIGITLLVVLIIILNKFTKNYFSKHISFTQKKASTTTSGDEA